MFALMGVLAGCDRTPAPQARAEVKPIDVQMAAVSRRAIDRSVDLTGTLFGQEEATVSSKITGRIVRLDHDLGDEVLPGQPLAQIDRTDLELALSERRAAVAASLAKLGLDALPGEDLDLSVLPAIRRARAEEANAQARFDRARQLFEQTPPLLSAQDFADIRTQSEVASRNAEAEVLTARALLAEARTQTAGVRIAEQVLADAEVVAPSPPGEPNLVYRIAERRVSVGEMVAPGQALFRLVASDRIKFRGSAPERFAGRLKAGQAASLRVEAFEQPFPAQVTRISPQVDPATRSFEVEIQAENPDGRLKPGAFARARVVTGSDADVAFVPVSAVVTFAGVQKVFGIKDGKAVEVRVETGVRDGDDVEIVGGLDLDQVVTGGVGGLSNSAPVRITEAAAAPVPPTTPPPAGG